MSAISCDCATRLLTRTKGRKAARMICSAGCENSSRDGGANLQFQREHRSRPPNRSSPLQKWGADANRDGLIAATARRHNLTIRRATTSDFRCPGLKVLLIPSRNCLDM